MEVWLFVDFFSSLENQHLNLSTKGSLLFDPDPSKSSIILVPSAYSLLTNPDPFQLLTLLKIHLEKEQKKIDSLF